MIMTRDTSIDSLIAALDSDPSACYGWSIDQIREVMGELGELENLVDALLAAEGQSIEARAEAIGVKVEDYYY